MSKKHVKSRHMTHVMTWLALYWHLFYNLHYAVVL